MNYFEELSNDFLKHKKDLSLKHKIKKLAYIRFNLGISLDMNDPKETTGGHEERLAFLREAVRRGWEICIYSEIKTKYRSFLTNPPAGLEFLKKIKYKPESFIDKDTDLVYIEHGPTNMMFRNSYNKECHIFRTYQLLANYEGVVFYHQSDPNLFFAINGYAFSASFYRNLNLGNPERILKNSQISIISKATNVDVFFDENNTYRGLYKGIGYDYLYWPSAFLGHRPGSFPIKENPTYELCYIGSQKARYNKFESYYNTEGKFKVDLFGNWEESVLKNRFPYIKYNGSIPQSMCEEVYNDSLCHVVIANDNFERLGVINTRYPEAVTSNTAVLIDEKLGRPIGVPEKFMIKDKADALNKYQILKNQTFEERKASIEEHKAFVMGINPVTLFDDLEIYFDKQKEKMLQVDWQDSVAKFKLCQFEYEEKALHNKDMMIRNKHIYLRMFKKLNYLDGVELKDPLVFPDGGLPRCCISCGKLIQTKKAYASRVRCKDCGGKFDSFHMPIEFYEILRNKELIKEVYSGDFEREKILEYLHDNGISNDVEFYKHDDKIDLDNELKKIDEYVPQPEPLPVEKVVETKTEPIKEIPVVINSGDDLVHQFINCIKENSSIKNNNLYKNINFDMENIYNFLINKLEVKSLKNNKPEKIPVIKKKIIEENKPNLKDRKSMIKVVPFSDDFVPLKRESLEVEF